MPTDLERISAFARDLLSIPDGDVADACLWQHSERVARLACAMASLPEAVGKNPDRDALTVAGLFHDAGWVIQLREGRFTRWQVLAKPTSDLQRELAAAFMLERLPGIVPAAVLQPAAEAVRNCNYRNTSSIYAQVLAEAENLDDVGALHLVKQIRQYLADGRSVDQLIKTWQRQKEYQYWEARIKDCLRFESTRRLAQSRLEALDHFMNALSIEQSCADVAPSPVATAASSRTGRT